MSKLSAEELVSKTLDRAYTLALRLTGNEADAWDLTQEALLKAIRALPGFRGDADPKTWVYRITINTWKNRVQSGIWRWWRRLVPLEPGTGAPADDPPPDRVLEGKERAEAFERALSELEPEDRAALVLRELDGMSYLEMAETLDVPIGTVKSRLHRARTTLARILEREDAA